ncbi:hypothetical protein EGM70_13960 [Enterobacteriaceae bacterium 89]|nr:hypothetical protein [Enterobacteriaceae bacterium 89]
MRKILLVTLSLIPSVVFANFINPMDFDGSQAQKDEVIQYIKDRVKKDYCDGPVNMCQESTLRMMEKSNLDAFKRATKATNKKIMDRVIDDYCNSPVDMCTYTTIEMMYNKNVKASKESLEW